MKTIKLLLLLSLSLMLFSCSDEEVEQKLLTKQENLFELIHLKDFLDVNTKSLRMVDQNELAKSDQLVIKFRDEGAFETIINELSETSIEDRAIWSANLEGYTSLQNIFEEAMKDVEDLDETEASYMAFKTKYEKYLYFPMYEEDYGVYMPVVEQEIASVINPNGLVIIGNELKNLKNITSYADLQETGQAYYDAIDQQAVVYNGSFTKAALPSNVRIVSVRNSVIGEERSSGWEKRKKRKLKLKFYRKSNKKNINPTHPTKPGELPKEGLKFKMNLALEVCFRKKYGVDGLIILV